MSARRRLERVLSRGTRDPWEAEDDDPAAGLVNLFDLWMVFAVAILLTAVGAARYDAFVPDAEARRIPERVRPTGRELTGRGEELGTAYRLESGEIVYVPR